jgi:hypothetical protein
MSTSINALKLEDAPSACVIERVLTTEAGLALMAVSLALVFSGAGRFLVDPALNRSFEQLRTLLTSLLAWTFWRSA